MNDTEIAQAINALVGFSASLDMGTGDITVISENGENLVFDTGSTPGGFSMDVDSAHAGPAVSLTDILGIGGQEATVGGNIAITLSEGVTIGNGANLVFANDVFTDVFSLNPDVNNVFDPSDNGTYNNATSVIIYDSLGTAHEMTQYFVKKSSLLFPPNTWFMYVQIDGQDVGDADPLAADPTAASEAQYTLRFNSDGSLDATNTASILISNWTPLNSDGSTAGSLGPLQVASGGGIPIPLPPTSSNFIFDIDGSTQFAGDFAVTQLDQSGFASGQLAGVDISDTGIIFARYSNGEALVLGQVALASFSNEQGLTPLGDTGWAESFETGEPIIGAPRTSSLGAITSGALEDSNVELAEELVALIIAQRNFQANSRTIETANEITQTIINLR